MLAGVAPARPAPGPAVDPVVVRLWPGPAPGETGAIGDEHDQGGPDEFGAPVIRLTNVSEPAIHVYRPPPERATGAAVVVCPGGSYNILAWNLEGTEVAAWLNSVGVTAVLLKFRVPARHGRPAWEAPLQDAQRALRLVRASAGKWGIDPQRVGIIGFSAGGHLAAAASTRFDVPAYAAIDDVDLLSPRPDFTMLVYPAFLAAGRSATRLVPEITVTPGTPPAFIVHSRDDQRYIDSSIAYFTALKSRRLAVEMRLYPTGGHGYGLRHPPGGIGDWPQHAAAWMQGLGLLKPAGSPVN